MSGLCCSSDVRSLYLLIGEFVCPAFDMSMIRVSMYWRYPFIYTPGPHVTRCSISVKRWLQFVIISENTCTSYKRRTLAFGYEIGTKKCDLYTSNYGNHNIVNFISNRPVGDHWNAFQSPTKVSNRHRWPLSAYPAIYYQTGYHVQSYTIIPLVNPPFTYGAPNIVCLHSIPTGPLSKVYNRIAINATK